MQADVPSFAYERIEHRLESLIAKGTLRPGDRLPSVRALCRSEGVSPATATQALAALEAKSLVRARPRSGFYVQIPNRLPLPSSSVLEITPAPLRPRVSEDVARVFRDLRNPDVIPLGAGVPDPALLPTEEISRCVARAARQSPKEFARYGTDATDLPLRTALAQRLAACGCDLGPDELVITHGCLDALNLALRAVAVPGDTVLIESPTFFGILQSIESLGLQALPIPATCEKGIDMASAERAIRNYSVAACLLVPSFGNPHGACLSDERKQRLVEMFGRRGIPIIEDDIYGDLGFEESRPRPIKAFGNPSDTLLCGSLSKTLSPSLRVGWIAAGRHRESVQRLQWITSVATPHVTAKAAADYLRAGSYDRHLRRFRRVLETQMCRISNAVACAFPEGTAMGRPRGGYFLWLELPRNVDSLALRDAATRESISLCPGTIFSSGDEYRHFIRLNCAVPWTPDARRAITRLGELASDLASPRPTRKRATGQSHPDP